MKKLFHLARGFVAVGESAAMTHIDPASVEHLASGHLSNEVDEVFYATGIPARAKRAGDLAPEAQPR